MLKKESAKSVTATHSGSIILYGKGREKFIELQNLVSVVWPELFVGSNISGSVLDGNFPGRRFLDRPGVIQSFALDMPVLSEKDETYWTHVYMIDVYAKNPNQLFYLELSWVVDALHRSGLVDEFSGAIYAFTPALSIDEISMYHIVRRNGAPIVQVRGVKTVAGPDITEAVERGEDDAEGDSEEGEGAVSGQDVAEHVGDLCGDSQY